MSSTRFSPPYWKLVQAFLREATEDEHFDALSNDATGFETAYVKLRQLQRGHFQTSVTEGRTLVASTVGAKQFSFQIPDGMASGDIMAIAETALEILSSAGSINQARALLRRRKTTKADFSHYRP